MVYLPGIKLAWLCPTKSFMSGLRRFASTMETILMTILLRHIGRNSEVYSGLSVFGIKKIKDWLMCVCTMVD